MVSRERVESVLNRVRPFLQADGGDIELIAVSGNSADVRLTGMCAGCPSAHMTLTSASNRRFAKRFRSSRRSVSCRCRDDRPTAITMDSVVVGSSARMRAVFEFLRVIGNSDSTVLITGESGTGKEVTATLIHQASRRKHHPFVAVSCALFSETLIESELFGHERGAFTGAIKDRPGRFELADGGTIFLDDIDDVPLSMQVKLLRVLQNRTIERLGGDADGTGQRPHHRRQQARSQAAGRRRQVPGGPLLSAERPAADAAAAAGAAGRHPGADGPLSRAVLPRGATKTCRQSPTRSARRSPATTGRATCGSSRTPASASPRPARAERCGSAACRRASCSAPVRSRPRWCCRPRRRADAAPISLDDRLREVEANLIGWALKVSGGNKSRAAELLQIKRSTLGDRINRCGLGGGESQRRTRGESGLPRQSSAVKG